VRPRIDPVGQHSSAIDLTAATEAGGLGPPERQGMPRSSLEIGDSHGKNTGGGCHGMSETWNIPSVKIED
jgi:hypothetical protein